MSLMPPPDDWVIEEPPDLYFPAIPLEEPPDWVFESIWSPEPPDLFPNVDDPVLQRMTQYAPPPIPPAQDYPLPEEFYTTEPLDLAAEAYPVQGTHPPASEGLPIERDSTGLLRLQHTGILIEEVFPDPATPNATPDHYAVGVVEVWQDPQTGDQTGAYLHMADAPHLARAEEMRSNIYHLADEAEVADADLGDFAHGLIKGRGDWQPLTNSQWRQVDHTLAPDTPNFQDDTTWAAKDRLLAQTFTLTEPEVIDDPLEVSQSVHRLGLQAAHFDPLTTPPPLFDEASQTSYWIGVYQPDPTDPSAAITSLLSIAPDEHGLPVANLTPVTTGDFAYAQQSADYLLGIASKTGNVAQVLEAAEGLALAHQSPEAWEIGGEAPIAISPVGPIVDF